MQQLRMRRDRVTAEPRPRRTGAGGAETPQVWTLKKREVIRMLMAMDRYRVDSVVLKADDPDLLGWEIAPLKKPR